MEATAKDYGSLQSRADSALQGDVDNGVSGAAAEEGPCRGARRHSCSRWMYLLASGICAGFAVGYQAIAACTWMQYFFLILFLESSSVMLWWEWLALWLVQTLGVLFAFAGTFNDPGWDGDGVGTTIAVAFVISLLVLLAAMLHTRCHTRVCAMAVCGGDADTQRGTHTHAAHTQRCLGHAATLAFPVGLTAFYTIFGAVSPTGFYGHPAYAQHTITPLVQLTSALGIHGLGFLVMWVSTALAVLVAAEACTGSSASGVRVRSTVRTHALIAVVVALVALTLGDANSTVFDKEVFYQRATQNTVGSISEARLGCVIALEVEGDEAESVWTRTEKMLNADGADLVLWSEEALLVEGRVAESLLLARAENLSTTYNAQLGVAYALRTDGKQYNTLTLVKPDGSIGFRYHKTHPVPGVESEVTPGKDRWPPVADTSLGRVSGAICFDLDFPDWVRGAGRHGASLFLQPSATWGPIGPLHAYDNGYRAVENGMSIFRCSSGGISGYITSRYTFHALQYTTVDSGDFMVSAPLYPHRPVFYPVAGFAFGWLCVALLALYLLLLLLPLHTLNAVTHKLCRHTPITTTTTTTTRADATNDYHTPSRTYGHKGGGAFAVPVGFGRGGVHDGDDSPSKQAPLLDERERGDEGNSV